MPDPDYDAGLLMEMVTGEPALKLRSGLGDALTDEQISAYEGLIQKRKDRIPLQYLLGNTVFMGDLYKVRPGVLIPRPETEMIAEEAIRLLREGAMSTGEPAVLDLCCGSGCLGISVKRAFPAARITLTDMSPIALETARENAERLGADCEMLQGDLFETVTGRKFDLVLSNPPYIPAEECGRLQAEVMQEPRMALDGGRDGLDFYRRIAAEAGTYLRRPGFLILEIGYGEAKAVEALLLSGGAGKVQTDRDFSGIPRRIRAEYGTETRPHVQKTAGDQGTV